MYTHWYSILTALDYLRYDSSIPSHILPRESFHFYQGAIQPPDDRTVVETEREQRKSRLLLLQCMRNIDEHDRAQHTSDANLLCVE